MPQSLSQLWVHIIFSTKNRYPFLKDFSIQQKVHEYIKRICIYKKCNTVIVGGTDNHVHLLVDLHKNISISDLVEEIKKTSSRWIKTLPEANGNFDKFYWQRGYGAFSVSHSKIDTVSKYIENQNTHHKKWSYEDEFRKFLMQYEVAFNEEYLWD